MSHRAGLGAEHPLNDRFQGVFLLVFLVVWGLDSFVFRFSTVLAEAIPVLARLPLVVVSFTVGVYLIVKSGAAVFGRNPAGEAGKSRFLMTGVYAWTRHPMYLGSLLVVLAFFFSTFSLLSLMVWVGFFAFYDRMAAYEEQDLIRILDGQYLDYRKQVPKWLLRVKRKQVVQ